MSQPKELHFFDKDNYTADVANYSAHFRHRERHHKFVGESTPFYMNCPRVPERIRDLLGDVKIVVALRNPVSRAYSHYWHEVKLGWEDLTFDQALLRESERLTVSLKYWQHYSYFTRGFYSVFMTKWYELFGRGNVLVLRFEDMVTDMPRELEKVLLFLGADTRPLSAIEKEAIHGAQQPRFFNLARMCRRLDILLGERNALSRVVRKLNLVSRRYPPMSAVVRKSLEYAYSQENEAVRQLTGVGWDWTDDVESDVGLDDRFTGLQPAWGRFRDYWVEAS